MNQTQDILDRIRFVEANIASERINSNNAGDDTFEKGNSMGRIVCYESEVMYLRSLLPND